MSWFGRAARTPGQFRLFLLAPFVLVLVLELDVADFYRIAVFRTNQFQFARNPDFVQTFLQAAQRVFVLQIGHGDHALDSAPDCAWLVVACDLPLLDEATIAFLVDHRDPMCQATAFRSSGDGMPEPLCTIYEPSAFNHFLGLIDKGISCPRKALQNSNTKLFDPPFFRALDNANTPQEAQQLLWWLKKGKADS